MKRSLALGFGAISTVAVAFGASSPVSADTLTDAIQDGADRVAGLQDSNGEWGYPLTAPPTYTNVVGPNGQGVLSAFDVTNDTDHLNSAKAAGDALVGETEDWVGTYNPMFLVEAADATSTSAPTASEEYQGQAQSFYTDLTAGTYTRKGTDYNTDEYIELVHDNRANYEPWDLAPLAIAAESVGTTTQQNKFTEAVKAGINSLDDSKELDVLGLSGGLRALGRLGETFDPTDGAFASANSLSELADTLASLQNPDGSWSHSSNSATRSSYDESITANAILALLEVRTIGQYDDEILAGREFLIDTQKTNGGWLNPEGDEYAQIDAENVEALADTAAVPLPGPTAMALVGFAGLGLAGLRRRKREQQAG